MKAIDKFQRFGQTIYNSQDVLKNHILYKYPIHLTDNTEDHSVVEQYASEHEFVWIVDRNIETLREFPWWFKPVEKEAIYLFPYIYKASKRIKSWNKVKLVPTRIQTEKKITKNFVCGIYDVYCGKDQFDIFFIGNQKTGTYEQLINRFIDVVAVNSIAEAQEKSTTDMFWLVPDDIVISDFFKFSYQPDDWSQKYTHVFGNGKSDTRDGIALFPKNYNPTERELKYRYYANKKELNIIASKPRSYEKYSFKTYNEYLTALTESKTEMFWFVPDDVIVKEDFDFNLYFDHQNQYDRSINHVWLNGEHYDGIALFSKNSPVTEKEFNHRFYANKKEWNTVASIPKPYDRFKVDNYDDYILAKQNSTTDMFWGIPSDVIVDYDFKLYFSHHENFDKNITHVFLNDKTYDGVALFSKNVDLTEHEIAHRFYVNKKEWSINVSTPKPFDYFNVDSYNDYLIALDKSTTNMFWVGSRNIEVDQNLINNFYISHHEVLDRNKTHAFKHVVDDKTMYNGLFLVNKNKPLTEREIEYRFPAERIEQDIVGSVKKKYDQFTINNYVDYFKAFESSTTELFWGVPSDVNVVFDFDLYFEHNNEYDRRINHVMLNGEHRDGIVLFSKHSPVTEKEIENRFYVNKKDWDIVASTPKQYEKFSIDTYQDYLNAVEKSATDMFWMIPPEVIVNSNFKFDLYFPHYEKFEREINHVFMNGPAYDGVSLISKKCFITEKEIKMRFFANKKQYETVASNPHRYDIVFISNDEEHADENYQKLLERFPQAKRVHGVKGVHNAHIAAAKLCSTDMIWIVDADAEIIPKFNFDYYVPAYDPDSRKTVHVWKAQNPINSLVYGYGAVKLLPREMTENMDTSKPDMTTSISPYFKSINRISNITRFNTDPFSTWRSAFRETVKLASKSINGQLDEETDFRLNVWCTKGKDKPFGEYCIAGALAGRAYGLENTGDLEALKKINDFAWLKEQFDQTYESV